MLVIKIIFHFLFFITLSHVCGQGMVARQPQESVSVFLDRDLYCSGERIQFSATLVMELPSESSSQILYAEVITPDGRSVVGGKFPFTEQKADGCLMIPRETLSGLYYFRAYTRWMRNDGPESYAYIPIRIVNAFRNEVLSGDRAKSDFSEKNDPVKEIETSTGWKINTDKNVYQPKQMITVSISPKQMTTPFENVCVSVVPAASAGEIQNIQPHAEQIKSDITFYPETRGVSLTGQVKDLSTEEPIPNAKVNLSIIGKGRDFMAIQTDSAGRYFFSLPDYMGYRDLFICTERDSLMHPQVLVDNDFCTLPVNLPAPPFVLTPDERKLVLALARNVQINQQFSPDTLLCPQDTFHSDKAFYGDPSEVIYFDQFVQLPTLEEYFNELPTPVKVRKQGGHKYFKVLGPQEELSHFAPLVLVDWVAINNPEEILTAPPTTISRIEVITVPYVKGNITYGGIVSIISRNGDFAGIDLPVSGLFLNYLFETETCTCSAHPGDYATQPDARNTLYWDPHVHLASDQTFSFSFPASETPGQYTIVVEGRAENGNPSSSSSDFTIEQ